MSFTFYRCDVKIALTSPGRISSEMRFYPNKDATNKGIC